MENKFIKLKLNSKKTLMPRIIKLKKSKMVQTISQSKHALNHIYTEASVIFLVRIRNSLVRVILKY